MSAFDKAFRSKQTQHIDALPGLPQPEPATMQERAIAMLLKQVLPGFDLEQMKQLGTDVQKTVDYFKTKIDCIEEQNNEILALLKGLSNVGTDNRRSHYNGSEHADADSRAAR